ncbi:MAG: hypothetical protein ACI89X_002746 [Planctomycetota bacterium]
MRAVAFPVQLWWHVVLSLFGEGSADLGRTEQATRMMLSRARADLTHKLDQLHRDKSDS